MTAIYRLDLGHLQDDGRLAHSRHHMCAHLCQNDNNEYLNQSHISENLGHWFSHLHLGGSSCHIRHTPTYHKCILTSITHEIQV